MKRILLFLLSCLALSSPSLRADDDNPLPHLPAGRHLHFGYFFTELNGVDYNDETRCYTNLYIPAVPVEQLDASLGAAAGAGQDSYLSLDLKPGDETVEEITEKAGPILNAAANHWDHVAYIEAWHEPNVHCPPPGTETCNSSEYFPPSSIPQRIANLRQVIANLGLEPRPVGAMLDRDAIYRERSMWTGSSLDWLGIEAFFHPDEDQGSACAIAANLKTRLRYIEERLAPKNLVLAIQSYDNNGAFENIPGLLAMQQTYYTQVYDHPRVLALASFAYVRSENRFTRNIPGMVALHKQIGERARRGLPEGCSEPVDPLPSCAGTGPSDLRLDIVNVWANLSWVNGSAPFNSIEVFQDGHHIEFIRDPNQNSFPVHLGVPPASGTHTCFQIQAHLQSGNSLDPLEACGDYFPNFPDVTHLSQNSPLGCINELAPRMTWEVVPQTTKHWIYINHTPDNTDVVDDQEVGNLPPCVPGISLRAGHRYRWKVNAGNNFGFSPTWPYPAEGLYFTPLCSPRADWNNAGSADLLFRNPSNGDLSLVYLNGGTLAGTAALNPAKPVNGNWTAVGTNDFNGDHKPDVVWQNNDSGNLSLWLFDGANRALGVVLAGPGISWKVAGTGDFNFDGKPDLLFRQPGTQNLKAVFLNGTSYVSEATITSAWSGYDTWEIAAVGDLDNDLSPDIVWRQPGTGNLVMWRMQGTNVVYPASTAPQLLADPNWRMVSILDVDKNGANDIVWQNDLSGRLVVWYMEGLVRRSGGFLTPDTAPDASLRAIGPR